MLSLLGVIEQCLKAGKKQHWRTSSITNICVGLLAGFKVLFILLMYYPSSLCRSHRILIYGFHYPFQSLLSFRPQTLGQDILGLVQSIFQVGHF